MIALPTPCPEPNVDLKAAHPICMTPEESKRTSYCHFPIFIKSTQKGKTGTRQTYNNYEVRIISLPLNTPQLLLAVSK